MEMPVRKPKFIINTNLFKSIIFFLESKNVNIFTDMADKLCDLELELGRHQKGLSAASNCLTMEDFDQVYSREFDKGSNPKNTNKYKDFVAHAKTILDWETNTTDPSAPALRRKIDDDMTMEEDINTTDPFTKKDMIIPVRNRRCNHVYDKDSVDEVLKVNPRTKCPVIGCPSNDFIRKEDLIEDKDLRQKILTQQHRSGSTL